MKRNGKTLFALLLALVMTLGLAATAWATEGNSGTVVLPDGPVINQPTPEVPEAYKIPFTKVVEQAGTCAPGKETFRFEAVNHVIDATEYPDVQRSVEIETNGAGTYQGTLTITGPARQVENFIGRGICIHEVGGNDRRWTYSDKEYIVNFETDTITGMPKQTFYLNNEVVSEMTFTNIYTENLRTVEVPFTKTVKLGGNTAPGRTDFTLEIFRFGNSVSEAYKDVTYTAAVTTRGVGSYDGKLIISGPEYQVQQCISEGIYVREVNGGASGWTYSTAEWYVDFTPREDQDGKPLPFTIHPNDVQGAPVDKMTFENTYTYNRTTPAQRPTEKPNTPETTISSPKTFDAGVALYGVSALLSLSGTALLIKRKNG